MTAYSQDVSTVTPDGVIRCSELSDEYRSMAKWDGSEYPWVPPATVAVPGLELDTEFERDLDPITYQVLRYRLWNVNLAHSDAIKKVSGAPYVCYLDDFSTSIHTENGDTVLCGPSMVYFVGLADLGIKWTLQNRSGNPGIRDGDVFLHNDPYIGVTHQNDVAMYAPIFHDGKLFSWVYSGAHQPDVGGMQEGSWCPNAVDIYQEASPWPPVRVVEQGELRRDLLELFTRHSRASAMVELQLRGQLAGLEAARRRIREMLDEHGPAVVKGAMRRMIADTSAAVSRRLLSLPDGENSETWRMSVPGQFDRTYRMSRTLRKEGDLLTFSNEGTDPQIAGGVNGTYATFRSGAVVAASVLLAWDQLYCPAGVLNHLRFEPHVGTLSIAKYPGAVSTQLFTVSGMHHSRTILSRLLLAGGPEVRDRATAATMSQGSTVVPMGAHVDGSPSYANFWDRLMGSTAASPSGDGEDIGGAWFQPSGGGANVEEIESGAPMLYLYRRELPDSGGPGRYRGGNGLSAATVPHKARYWMVQPVGNDPSIICTPGFGGGWPAYPGTWFGKQETGLAALMSQGRLPANREELAALIGDFDRMTSRSNYYSGDDGVVVLDQGSSGGYGDPIRRSVDAVLHDVESGSCTSEFVEKVYGVVLRHDAGSGTLMVDEEATRERRATIRKERLEAATSPAVPLAGRAVPTGSGARSSSDGVDLVGAGADAVWACNDCGRLLATGGENFRSGAALIEQPPQHLDPALYPDPAEVFDASVDFVLRRWHCPECGLLLSVESAIRGDEPLSDLRIRQD